MRAVEYHWFDGVYESGVGSLFEFDQRRVIESCSLKIGAFHFIMSEKMRQLIQLL